MNSDYGTILLDEPLASYTTLKIGGPSARLFFAASEEELSKILTSFREEPLILGAGSNLLISDRGTHRPVIKLTGHMRTVSRQGNIISAGAGVRLPELLRFCIAHRLTGLEPFAGIPGSLGGMVKMNASAHGCAVSDYVTQIEAFTRRGRHEVIPAERLDFRRRHCALSGAVITRVKLCVRPANKDIRGRIRAVVQRRLRTQDYRYPSCGCVFRNPSTAPAGKLIDECGLKGLRRGGALISPVHANFIVNTGGARYADVDFLISQIRRKVYDRFRVRLKEEVTRWSS
ncbi:MAG: UDP-N-acetylmuramate dehydrogenase [Candidatus Omnitrophica bacterium]|nr:UDP-N-acetylmuramate dehydrogenase [Candidatus Omnitrophota bacterium]